MSDDAVHIRAATEDDLPAVHAILGHYIRETVVTWRDAANDELLELANVQCKYRERSVGDWLVADAVKERRVIGFAYASPFKALRGWQQTVEDSVYIEAGWHGQGLGARLLSRLLGQTAALGFRQMVAMVAVDGSGLGENSVRLHRRLGFREVGRLEACGSKLQHQDMDCLILQKTLLDAAAAMHEATAERYAADMRTEMERTMYTERLPRFVDGCPSEGVLVDVGCGSGDCLALVHRHAPDVPLLGVDPSPALVRLARQQLPTAQVTRGDAVLTVQAARGVLCYFVIHFFDAAQLTAALASWSAALRPGGRLLVGFWIGTTGEPMDYGDKWKAVRAQYWSRADVEHQIKAAGLEVLSSEEEPYPEFEMQMGFIEARK